MGTIGIYGGIVIMVIKAISEPCTCIHIVVVKCTLCSCTCTYIENIKVTQCACIHVHVSYYGIKVHLGCVHVYRVTDYNY